MNKYRNPNYRRTKPDDPIWQPWVVRADVNTTPTPAIKLKEKTTPNMYEGAEYRLAQQTGKIIMRNYKAHSINVEDSGIVCDFHMLDPGYIEHVGSGTLYVPKNVVEYAISRAVDDVQVNKNLVTYALADHKEASVDLLTTLAELPETVKMFLDVFKMAASRVKGAKNAILRARREARTAESRKAKAYEAYLKRKRRGKPMSFATFSAKYDKKTANARSKRNTSRNSGRNIGIRSIDKATETWLLYRYGIMPLVYTARDLGEALEGKINKYVTSRKRDIQLKGRKTLWAGKITGPGIDPDVVINLDIEEYIERVTIKSCFTGNTLARTYGINPAVTAWELTTLSFVVDWFIQVGDLLQALGPDFADQTAAVYSRRIKGVVSTDVSVVAPVTNNPNGSVKATVRGTSVHGQLDLYDRVVIRPESHLTLPMDVKLNWKRTIDGFSLSWPSLREIFSQTLKELTNGKIQHRTSR